MLPPSRYLSSNNKRSQWLDAKDLLNNRMAYVAVSRGHVAYLFTNDRERLPVALRHEVSQQSAHVPQIGVEQAMPTPQPEISQRIEYGYGISMEGDALDGGKDHLFRIRE